MDLETRGINLTVGPAEVRVYAGGVREVNIDLRPLAFGAAWKILDLIVEYALASASTGAGRTTYVTIEDKRKSATTAAGVCPPLTADIDLWRTLTAAYAATVEARHSLIHRMADVDQATGALTGRDRAGAPLPQISAEEQEAFCRAVQRAVTSVLRGVLTPRDRSDMAWQLDRTTGLHGHPPLGGKQFVPPPLLIASATLAGDHVIIDRATLLDAAAKTFPGRAQVDASLRLPDGRHLLVEVEAAPSGTTEIDLAHLPPWTQLWAGP